MRAAWFVLRYERRGLPYARPFLVVCAELNIAGAEFLRCVGASSISIELVCSYSAKGTRAVFVQRYPVAAGGSDWHMRT
eukprot:11211342-Lingulodinium_polyedra.AAC.1